MDTPRHAYENRQAGFNGSAINPISGTPGIFTFAGRDGVSKYANQFDKNNFGPKLGFAYRFDEKTVVRGGYGLGYLGIYSVGTPLSLISGFSTNINVASLARRWLHPGISTFDGPPRCACSATGTRVWNTCKRRRPIQCTGVHPAEPSQRLYAAMEFDYPAGIEQDIAVGSRLYLQHRSQTWRLR